jgi:CubicO group peptidase (beta-lactamase class C family)
VLSAIVQKQSGKPTSEYARERIFTRIGMTSVDWNSDRNGISKGGTDIYMTPRDMARFGLLMLNEGEWDGLRILPAEWVKEATSTQTAPGIPGGEQYGYYFWLTEMHGYEVYEAMGSGGQFIAVVPDLDLVVVQTSTGVELDPLLMDYILPSVMEE